MNDSTFRKRRAHVDRLHGQWIWALQNLATSEGTTSEGTIRRKFRRYRRKFHRYRAAKQRLWRDANPHQRMQARCH